jgi:hypothetical protein
MNGTHLWRFVSLAQLESDFLIVSNQFINNINQTINMTENTQELFQTKQKNIDRILNKTVLDIAIFSTIGWSVGLVAGLFFHQKAPIRNLMAGIGGSYGFVNNKYSLKQFV